MHSKDFSSHVNFNTNNNNKEHNGTLSTWTMCKESRNLRNTKTTVNHTSPRALQSRAFNYALRTAEQEDRVRQRTTREKKVNTVLLLGTEGSINAVPHTIVTTGRGTIQRYPTLGSIDFVVWGWFARHRISFAFLLCLIGAYVYYACFSDILCWPFQHTLIHTSAYTPLCKCVTARVNRNLASAVCLARSAVCHRQPREYGVFNVWPRSVALLQ